MIADGPSNADFHRAIRVICKEFGLEYSIDFDDQVEVVFPVVGTQRSFDTLEKAFHYLGGYRDAKQGIK